MCMTHCQGLQDKTDEEPEFSERNRHRRRGQEAEFWRIFQVGMVQGISVNNAQN